MNGRMNRSISLFLWDWERDRPKNHDENVDDHDDLMGTGDLDESFLLAVLDSRLFRTKRKISRILVWWTTITLAPIWRKEQR